MGRSKTFGNTEMIQVADAVAREKGIPRDVVLEAMETSIAVAARKKYGHDKSIKSHIDRKTGEISLYREWKVVSDDFVLPTEEEEEAEARNARGNFGAAPQESILRLADAKEKNADAEIGGLVTEALPPIDLGRVAAQSAKQVIVQKVRDAERERQYQDFKNRMGEVINGVVKRVEFGNVIVEMGSAEAIIPRRSQIRGENFRVNDRIRAYLEKVERLAKGPQLFLSRTAPEFMAKLFAQEVPEIYDGIIEIKSVAREPGSRAKIAVVSRDSNIDPVGSCVGMRGARVQAVSAELQGEKIDIIQWSPDPATFLVNALAPAEVAKVVIDEDTGRIEAVVPDGQLSLAIGRRGQNVRLASELTGWRIDVMTEEDESTRRTEEFDRLSKLFMDALNIEEIMANLLATEDFSSVEEIAYVALGDLASIEGFDEDLAAELQQRARDYLEQKKNKNEELFEKLGVAEDLAGFAAITPDVIVALAEKGIKNLDGVADLSRDEFVELVPNSGLSDAQIDQMIMEARAHWFEEEAKKEGAAHL